MASESPEQALPALVARLLAGPDDVELNSRDLAFLRAWVRRPVSFSSVQQERQKAGASRTWEDHQKLRGILGFNDKLAGLVDAPQPQDAETGEARRREPAAGGGEDHGDGDLLPAKQIRDLLPDLFPTWKVMKAFLESHPVVRKVRRGQHWFVDLTGLVQAKLRDGSGDITDGQIEKYLAGVARRKAEVDAARNRPKK